VGYIRVGFAGRGGGSDETMHSVALVHWPVAPRDSPYSINVGRYKSVSKLKGRATDLYPRLKGGEPLVAIHLRDGGGDGPLRPHHHHQLLGTRHSCRSNTSVSRATGFPVSPCSPED